MRRFAYPAFSCTVLALAFIAQTASAEVRLPRLLSDGVVLQRNAATSIWGWADDGESVAIYLDDKPLGSAEPADGRWIASIGPVAAGGPHVLKVEGKNSITLEDVYFGDVWLASGQSNMQLSMERVKEKYAADIAGADVPLIRVFTVPRQSAFKKPLEDLDAGTWVPSTPSSVLDFSAVAYFFANEIHERFGVPVGIVSSNYGGSTVEGWMCEEALRSFPHYLKVARRLGNEEYLQGLLDADRHAAETWYDNIDALDKGLTGTISWSAPEYDDSGWPRMDLPGFWADTELGPVNGVVWFRKTFELPRSAEGMPARLMLGRIVDADTTYVNGTEVGAITYQYPPRRYDIGSGILRAGENTIAVRVVNSAGHGGFVEDKPYELTIELTVGKTTIDLKGPWRFKAGARSEPLDPPQFTDYKQPLGFYNAMIAPLQNMTIKGVIWYQGESNVDRPGEYARSFPALIRDWRGHWGQGDFPFLFVQLANFLEPVEKPSESNWAELRNAQLSALDVPNTAMAVAIDVGEWNDIHPLNKKAVGHRLALAARKIAYGETDLVSSGPIFRSLVAEDGRLILEFDHTGSGLAAKGDELQGFAIAGRDGDFVWARARIDGDKVVVWNEAVDDPASVRYAWADNPVNANLYNREGLPASPFQASGAD